MATNPPTRAEDHEIAEVAGFGPCVVRSLETGEILSVEPPKDRDEMVAFLRKEHSNRKPRGYGRKVYE